MAAKKQDFYGRHGVYGSAAYDFKYTPFSSEDDYCVLSEKNSRDNRKKTKSPALFISCLLTAALLFSGLMARSSMVVAAEEIHTLQSEIETLLEEQTRLKISHEKAFPMEQTENYAIEVLGMQKPMPYQIVYIDVASPNHENFDKRDSKIENPFSFLREYFPLGL